MPVTSDKKIVVNKVRQRMVGMYFAVMKEHGFVSADAKQFAKDKYQAEHFNDISNEQLADILNSF